MLAPVLLCFYWYKSQSENQISEIRATISGLQSQIKEALDIKNIELSHQTDKSGENQDQETQSSPSDVKSEDEKTVDTMQCHNLDKNESNDDQKDSGTTVTWWSWIKNLGIQSYGVLMVFNHLFMGGLILRDVLGKMIN